MANEDDKTVVEGTPPAADAAPAKKGGNKLLLFGGIGVGTIVIGVVLALFVLKPMMASSDDPTEPTARVEKEEKASHSSKDKPKAHGEGGGGESLMYEISDIVINPAGTGGSRFLSVSFGFELETEAEVIDFRLRDAVIRDALITILSSKTVAQLTDARQKEIIRYQIKKRVTDLMKTDQLAGVYYTDFVLQ